MEPHDRWALLEDFPTLAEALDEIQRLRRTLAYGRDWQQPGNLELRVERLIEVGDSLAASLNRHEGGRDDATQQHLAAWAAAREINP